MPTNYLAPGTPWRRSDADRQARRFVDREVGLHVTFEGGPVDGSPYRVAHLEWVAWLYRRHDGHLICRPGAPAAPSEPREGETVLGCYVYEPQEEGMRWRDAGALETVTL